MKWIQDTVLAGETQDKPSCAKLAARTASRPPVETASNWLAAALPARHVRQSSKNGTRSDGRRKPKARRLLESADRARAAGAGACHAPRVSAAADGLFRL